VNASSGIRLQNLTVSDTGSNNTISNVTRTKGALTWC